MRWCARWVSEILSSQVFPSASFCPLSSSPLLFSPFRLLPFGRLPPLPPSSPSSPPPFASPSSPPVLPAFPRLHIPAFLPPHFFPRLPSPAFLFPAFLPHLPSPPSFPRLSSPAFLPPLTAGPSNLRPLLVLGVQAHPRPLPKLHRAQPPRAHGAVHRAPRRERARGPEREEGGEARGASDGRYRPGWDKDEGCVGTGREY